MSANIITITNSTFKGAKGGGTTLPSDRESGAAGHGGGSVFGGVSTGASGSGSSLEFASGGHGGDVKDNVITITDSSFVGEEGGSGGVFSSKYGGSGDKGHGGGSIFGGISAGGAGGYSQGRAVEGGNGGNGGDISNNQIALSNVTLTGAAGGSGGTFHSNFGGGAAAGHGGGSVFGGISSGGAAGVDEETGSGETARGGHGGSVSNNQITVAQSRLLGQNGTGGISGDFAGSFGGEGAAGHGGGSIFGGISSGGAGGSRQMIGDTSGGNGGVVSNNAITVTDTTFMGGVGGKASLPPTTSYEGGGAAGHGGGSVFGGISAGGAGGRATDGRANGGSGDAVTANTISITRSSLTGAVGGNSLVSDYYRGGGAAAGHGGGSVFGGISAGGAGGWAQAQAHGGAAGAVTDNTISITDTVLTGAAAGVAHAAAEGYSAGSPGLEGGSVFGGVSMGGSGGSVDTMDALAANGGNSGDTSRNTISLAGTSSISGDVYGGYTRGGAAGVRDDGSAAGNAGLAGQANHNTVTLIGEQLTIKGALYGGWSMNGDGQLNTDPAFTGVYQGNTLNPEAYRGSVRGIYHFENYNWTLPKNVVNKDTLIQITGNDPVQIDHTKHSVAMYNDGNQLYGGDAITMIDKVQGTALLTTPKIRQGHFLVYDASLDTVGEKLVLSIKGKEDKTPKPAGELHPTSKAFLESRLATLATLNQGANMVSDHIANFPVETCRTNVFGLLNGGSSRYKTGSHINVDDFSLVLGGAKCFELQDKSTVMLGAFFQHGNSNYDSYNHFGEYGEVYGWGKVRYDGGGLLFHMNVANTGTEVGNAFAAANIGAKNGLYLNASLSGGQARTNFDSNDLTDAQGIRGSYRSKSNYVTAMVGAGYAWRFDEKQMLDVYGRYSWGRLNSDSVMIGNDRLNFGSLQSSRVRLGTRYSYTAEPQAIPYVGLAYEHEFKGNASGTAYGMSIDQPSLKGSSGIVEVGVSVKPSAANKAWTVHLGAEFYMGDRRGMSGGMKVRYTF